MGLKTLEDKVLDSSGVIVIADSLVVFTPQAEGLTPYPVGYWGRGAADRCHGVEGREEGVSNACYASRLGEGLRSEVRRDSMQNRSLLLAAGCMAHAFGIPQTVLVHRASKD